jgi:hypothetical protein
LQNLKRNLPEGTLSKLLKMPPFSFLSLPHKKFCYGSPRSVIGLLD